MRQDMPPDGRSFCKSSRLGPAIMTPSYETTTTLATKCLEKMHPLETNSCMVRALSHEINPACQWSQLASDHSWAWQGQTSASNLWYLNFPTSTPLNLQQTTMMTFTPSTLPVLEPSQINDLKLSQFPQHLSTYHAILQAEQDVISARVLGYLLLEFHSWCHILGDKPCTELVSWVILPSRNPNQQEQHYVFFDNGKLCCDKFLRVRAFSNLSP